MGWLLAARSATVMDAVRSSARERSVQALAEFLTVFLAVVVWRAKQAQEGFSFQVQSDSTASLSASDQPAGKSVVTNFVAAELAPRLEVLGVREVDVLHVPGVLNKTAG